MNGVTIRAFVDRPLGISGEQRASGFVKHGGVFVSEIKY